MFASYTGRFTILFAGRFLGALALFAVNLLIVRFLGVEALADYAVFVSLVSILGICLFTGFNSVAAVFSAEYAKTAQPALLKGFVLRAIKTGAILVGGLLMVLILGRLLFPDAVDTPALIYLATVIVTAAAVASLGLNGAIQIGLKRQVAGLLPDILVRPVLLLSGSGLLLWLGLIKDIGGLYAMTAIAGWTAFATVLVFGNFFTRAVKNMRTETDVRRWYKAALPWLGTTLLWDYMIDIIILLSSILLGSAELAILHVCFRYRVLAGFGMRTIHTLLMPEITEHSIGKNQSQLRQKIRQANFASLGYTICALAGFLILGKWLLELFSLNAPDALPVLLVVTSTMLVRSIFGPAPLVLAVHDLHLATMLVSFAGLLFAGVWIWMLFPAHGVLAAATGYTGANLIISIVLWWYAKQTTSVDTSIFASRAA